MTCDFICVEKEVYDLVLPLITALGFTAANAFVGEVESTKKTPVESLFFEEVITPGSVDEVHFRSIVRLTLRGPKEMRDETKHTLREIMSFCVLPQCSGHPTLTQVVVASGSPLKIERVDSYSLYTVDLRVTWVPQEKEVV